MHTREWESELVSERANELASEKELSVFGFFLLCGSFECFGAFSVFSVLGVLRVSSVLGFL